MSRKLIQNLVASVAVVAITGAIHADVMTFQQGANSYTGVVDTMVNRASATNQGTNAQVYAGNLAGSTAAPYRTLIGYDLSDLKTAIGANPFVINSVSLSMYVNNTFGVSPTFVNTAFDVPFDLIAFGADITGSETVFTLNWNNGDGNSMPLNNDGLGALLSTKNATGGPGNTTVGAGSYVLTFDSTPAFAAAVADVVNSLTQDKLNMALKVQTEYSVGQLLRMASSNDANVDHRPLLTIDYTIVPEPASLALLLIGGATLLSHRSRKA